MIKIWILLSLCGIILVGCSVNSSQKPEALNTLSSQDRNVNKDTSSVQEQDLSKAFSLSLNTLLSLDHGWDKNMEFISIDFKDIEKEFGNNLPVIVENLKNHNVSVKQLSFDELEDQGLANEKGVLTGVLLIIDEANLTADNIFTVKGTVSKSAKQSVSATIELQQNDEVWEVLQTTVTSES